MCFRLKKEKNQSDSRTPAARTSSYYKIPFRRNVLNLNKALEGRLEIWKRAIEGAIIGN